jgi:hypothetical protein
LDIHILEWEENVEAADRVSSYSSDDDIDDHRNEAKKIRLDNLRVNMKNDVIMN